MERNGTTYNDATDPRVIDILERFRLDHGRQSSKPRRLRLYYGDPKVGALWGDVEVGYIGRSTGQVKIPLIVSNARSLGGSGILEHCIVRIETAAGRRCLYDARGAAFAR